MQIEKALINDRLRVLNVSWKLCGQTNYNFAVTCPWNFLFSENVAYILTVSKVFSVYKQNFRNQQFKGKVMQFEKALTNGCLCISKVSWKFRIPTIYNLALTYPWILQFFLKVAYFFTFFIGFSAYCFLNKTSRLNNLKKPGMHAEIPVFVFCVEAIIYFLLYNLHGCTFKNKSSYILV